MMKSSCAFALLFLGLVTISNAFVPNKNAARTFVKLPLRATKAPPSEEAPPSSSGDGATTEGNNKSPRLVAVQALTYKKGGDFPLDRLEVSPAFRKDLSVRDRSYARLLVTTVERRRGQIDKVLDFCQEKKTSPSKKLSRIDSLVQNVLRIGAAQLLFLNTPSHAAVMETVQVLRMEKEANVKETRIKFVNAVLRKIARERETILETAGAANESENVAPWLLDEWREAWGEEATQRIIAAAMSETPRCLSIRAGQTQAVQEAFEDAIVLPQGSIQITEPPQGAVAFWPLYQEGAWWMQDVSATIPALALYQALRGEKDSVQDVHVVDMCSAPGGKTAQLCNFGFRVTAIEKSQRRSKRLVENQKRLDLNCDIVISDAVDWMPHDTSVAGVLLDVPCTATGTCSKRPDVLRKKQEFDDLLDIQYRLACHAVNVLDVEGVLVYATCSLLKQESEDQIRKLLARDDAVKLETIPFQVGEIPGFDGAIDENGWIRVLPGSLSLDESVRQCDGFFVARLRRIQ